MSAHTPYDPYESHTPSQGGNNPMIKQVQNQINDTVDIMRQNIDRVQERSEQVDNLQNKASVLDNSARGFSRSAHDARKHFWWQNMKMKMCLIAAVIILIIVIVVPIVVHFK